MEKFTAAQARELMPNKLNEMIERIHNNIRKNATEGDFATTIIFSKEYNVMGIPFKVKRFLEEEDYGVVLTVGTEKIEFRIDWCDW